MESVCRLIDVLPEFARELRQLLAEAGEQQLAAQVLDLRIVDRCRCGDDFCSTIYTEPEPEGSYPPGHDTLSLDPESGMVNVTVVDRNIAEIEILDRPEIRRTLIAAVP